MQQANLATRRTQMHGSNLLQSCFVIDAVLWIPPLPSLIAPVRFGV